MMKFKIFLSCGQRDNEKIDGLNIVKYFTNEYENKEKIEIQFAENIYSHKGLTEVIYRNISKCDGFIGILHKRDPIENEGDKKYRSSLFVNQELAIYSYQNEKSNNDFWRIYQQQDIIIEGVNKYLMNRNILFETSDDIISEMKNVINEWLKIWKPTESIVKFEPPVLLKDHMGKGGLRGFMMEIHIDNLVDYEIENFIVGLVLPEEFQVEEKHSEIFHLQGYLNDFFHTDKRICHCIFSGKLLANYFSRWKIQFKFFQLENVPQEFQIGFYIRGDNIDFQTYYLKVNIIDPMNVEWDSNFGMNKEKCKIYYK